jgi:3-oxoacyl-[acyl-carrier-protein] synthase-3
MSLEQRPAQRVGIADLERYAPERFVSAAEIAEESGIPESVLVDKFGLLGKHVSEADEHVSDMCVAAARPLLERNDRADIDAVVYFGSHWKDYLVWSAAPKIQHTLGIEGFSLELINVSAGAPVALKVVADMMRSDPKLSSVLMVAASKESHLIDYSNRRSRFMLNFGDGAVAVLLRRDHDENLVLGSSLLTDGSFADDVGTQGGSIQPEVGRLSLNVQDPDEMKRRLDPITVKNFIKVTREAIERSGRDIDDIDLLLPIHFKKSLQQQILLELGLSELQTIYLDHYGHMSAVDPLFSLSIAREQGRVTQGDVIVLLAAGTGYTWGATVIEWGTAQ